MTHFGGVDLPPAGIAAGTMSGKPNKTELPVSSQGVPKRAGPWLAAALPHVAELTELLSSSQVEMETGVHTTFRIEMERGGVDGNAKMASIGPIIERMTAGICNKCAAACLLTRLLSRLPY